MEENSKSKGVAALLVSKMGPKEGEHEDMDDGIDAASEDVLSAIESKDPMALKEALKAFYELC